MPNWIKQLRYDPVAPLLAFGNKAIVYLAKRELLSKPVEDISAKIWQKLCAGKLNVA